MKKIDFKVPEGKLLRLKVDIKKNSIKQIKIAGDFFIHPEEAILEIEEFLTEININEIEKKLSSFLRKRKIQIIGFTPGDLQEVIVLNAKG